MDFCSKVAVKLLLKGVEKRKNNKNILTSPLSYNTIMNMTVAGSSNDTLVQILRFLERKNIEDVNSESKKFAEITKGQTRKSSRPKSDDDGEGPTISFLNGAWVNKNYRLKDSFHQLIENIYKAKIRSVSTPELVVKEANEWANASTKGLIKEVLREDHINQDTILIMGNSLYFKGSWKDTFIKSETVDMLFYLLDNKTIKVPFMTGCEEYSHKFFRDCQVARIPYSEGGDINRKFAMYIFLPYEKDGIQSLLRNVSSNPQFFNHHCVFPNVKVDIFYIPKFKFSYLTEEGPNIMKGMGLTLPFDLERAEFNEMIVEDENLCVSKIVQKAFIEVNEEGTEAASVTFDLGECGCSMDPPEKTEFIGDHPFMFVIREENSGVLFFAGTVLNPKED